MSVQMIYEKPRIAVCIPTAGMVSAWFMQAVIALLVKNLDTELMVMVSQSSVIHMNREKLVDQAMEMGATHVLFLDDDMGFDPSVLNMLLEDHEAVVGANYPMKQLPVAWTAMADGYRICTLENSTGIEPVDNMGFGVCLIETRVFKDLPRPWFLPLYEDGEYTTEDTPFFRKLKEHGYQPYIDHDVSKKVVHMGSFNYSWKHFNGK